MCRIYFPIIHTSSHFFLFFRHYVNTLIYRLNLFLFCLPVSAEHSWRHRRSWNSVLWTWPNSCSSVRRVSALAERCEIWIFSSKSSPTLFSIYLPVVLLSSALGYCPTKSWVNSSYLLVFPVSWCVLIERSLLMTLCLHLKNVSMVCTRPSSDYFLTVFIGFLYNNWSLRIL